MRRAVLLLTVMTAALLMVASPAWADTFTVNSTGDGNDLDFPGGTFDGSSDGKCFTGLVLVTLGDECTLRAAIQHANKSRGADTIAFSRPGVGPHTIEVGKPPPGSITGNGPLPPITNPVTIDGYTQGDATPFTSDDAVENTIPLAKDGTNAVLKIELDGTNAGDFATGLQIEDTSNVVVKGLVINRFKGGCIYSPRDGTGHRIEGNFIGTNPGGTVDEGNRVGVTLSGTDNSTIGGTLPKARNLISGNEAAGVEVGSGSGNKIQGNLIGTDKNGTADLGNGAWGVAAYSPSNTIGDSDPTDGATNAANTIAFNGNDGVNVFNGTGNRILSNSIFSNGGGFNGGLGIDLSGQTEDANGVTPNDPDDPTTSKPDPDKDTGPNGLQNYPLINSATTTPIGTAINGTLNSTPSTRKKSTFTIQFFSNPAADSPSGYGEGQTYLGQTQVTTDRQGNASFGFAPAQPVSVGRYITATATNTKTGGTSEFSQARVVVEPGFEQ